MGQTSESGDSLTGRLSLGDLMAGFQSGTLDLHRHIDAVCDRIETVDAVVQSFLPEAGRCERLHREADALLRQRANGGELPPLFGALVGVKDIFHVDGFVTHAGSTVPAETFAGTECAVARRVRSAGGLILGKTTTTEFAYFEPGATRNPHNPAHTPGGSSSGSAAAVGAGLAPLTIGTQTIGSVIRPAAFCGVTGFKPTFDRISTEGLVYFSPSLDHVGLFTWGIEDMEVAARVLCDGWREGVAAGRPVIGFPDGPYLAQAGEEALTVFRQALARAEGQGFKVRSVPVLAEIGAINQWHRRLAFGEFARQHARLYADYAECYRPRTREIIEIGKAISDAELDDLRARRGALREEIEGAMAATAVDVWASPAALGTAPQGIESTGDPAMNLPWTAAGMPAVTIRCGWGANGMPLGLQLAAAAGRDEELLAWAAQVGGCLEA